MSDHKNPKKEQEFSNLLFQIKLYIQNKELQALEYLIQGQSNDLLSKIKYQLAEQQKQVFQQVVSNSKSTQNSNLLENSIRDQQKVAAVYQEQDSQSEQVILQNFQKQFTVSGIIYGQNYSYPFLGLLQKMSMIYFPKSHPNPFPQSSLKMLHSLIQTLFTYVFDKKIKDHYSNKQGKHKKSFHNYLKEYLFFVFQSEYQKFISFHKVYKNIKSSIQKKQINKDHQLSEASKSIQQTPLTLTKNIQQLDYLVKISNEIKNQQQFKQFTKIKSLNFLYFGQKKLRELIDPLNNFGLDSVPKQNMELISFIICRFVKKMIFECIKQQKQGRLSFLNNNQTIQCINVKIIGNQLIDKCNKKILQFIKLEEPIDLIAKRTFLQEFYQYDYEKILPKSVIELSQRALIQKQTSSQSLPQYIWTNFKQYQSLWTQRIAGQQHILQQNLQHNSKKQKGKNNDYSKFIKNNLNEFYKNHTALWLKYLTMTHTVSFEETQTKNNGLKKNLSDKEESAFRTRKKIKLQSLEN